MPLRKKYGRKRKFSRKGRKPYKRKFMRRRRTAPNMSLVKTPYVSDTCFVKFKYTDSLKLTSPIGNTSFIVNYRGNGAAEPDTSVAYAQYPLGWETYVDQYKVYRCFASKIKIRFSNEGTHSVTFGVVPVVDIQTFVSNVTTRGLIAQRYSKYKMVSAGGGWDVNLVKSFMKTKKMFSNQETKSDLDFAATMTNITFQTLTMLPVYQWYWAIFGFSPDTTSAMAINANIEITYYCRLEVPRQPVYTSSGMSGVDDYEPSKVSTNDSKSIILV